jgi:hypothetical protein
VSGKNGKPEPPEGAVPPQNLDAETNVLGAILLAGASGVGPSKRIIDALRETGLTRRDFYYDKTHGFVYEAALSLVHRGEPTDFLAIEAELERAGHLEVVGGRMAIREHLSLARGSPNATHHARLIREKAHRRRELHFAGALERAALNGGLEENPEVLDELRGLMADDPPGADAAWLESAADLLKEPDPGPTPFLIEELIVDQAIAMMLGSWKVGKTWVLLEFAVSIVTGRPAFGRFVVSTPGPVIVVLEESGRAALHRRLDALRRGYALEADALADLHFAANRRVRLNDEGWKRRLLAAGRSIEPRAIFLDPFVRLKGADVDENIQREVGPVLDFMRDLRDESGAAVLFVHHKGHNGSHGRGSSDFEGYWESKISIASDEENVVRTLKAEHREAEATDELRYRLDFDEVTSSVRLAAVKSEKEEEVEAYLAEHPDASATEVLEKVGGRKQDVLRLVKEKRGAGSQTPEPAGTTPGGPSPDGGSEEGGTPRRGAPPGTTEDGLVPDDGNRALQDEADRLAERHADIGTGSA